MKATFSEELSVNIIFIQGRRSETDIQSQSNVNHKREEVISKINKVEYIDYRSYPLIIDWKEVSYKGSACKKED
jgi:hypothetical protein